MDLAKLDLARRLYVFESCSLSDICMKLDISMFTVREACEANDWDSQRKKHFEKFNSLDDNSLERHAIVAATFMLKIEVLVNKCAEPDTTWEEERKLRYQIENLQLLSQALDTGMNVERRAHGIRNTAPSVARDDREVLGVKYYVGLPEVTNTIEEQNA